jgi:hypothetical protein
MRSRLLVVGSLTAASLAAQNGYWAQLMFPASPSPRFASAMAYDSARDRLVLVGGLPGVTNETWENDGATWTLRTTTGPSGAGGQWYPQEFLAAAYDSQRQRTVVVQCDPSNGQTKTWEWNGVVWSLRTNSNVPLGRDGFALAYDSVRGRTVMSGGNSNGVGLLGETWEWDGTAWQQRSSGGPLPRRWHAMAFDAARGVTVLFGGRKEAMAGFPAVEFGDTWEWNGSQWVEYFGIAGPGPRHGHAMVFDASRGVAVLHGGDNGGGTTYQDTWEWNGTQWTNRQAQVAPSLWTALAYDSHRHRTVLFGGQTPTGTSDQTFAYTVTGQAASLTPYGSGCPGPTGVPLLAATAGSLPRLGATLALQLSNLPTGLLNVPIGWLGFDNTSWGGAPLPLALDPFGFPGCTALLAPAAAYSLNNVAGVASWSIAIPFEPAYAGMHFFVQGGVVVLGFNPGGLVFTRGLEGVIGT